MNIDKPASTGASIKLAGIVHEGEMVSCSGHNGPIAAGEEFYLADGNSTTLHELIRGRELCRKCAEWLGNCAIAGSADISAIVELANSADNALGLIVQIAKDASDSIRTDPSADSGELERKCNETLQMQMSIANRNYLTAIRAYSDINMHAEAAELADSAVELYQSTADGLALVRRDIPVTKRLYWEMKSRITGDLTAFQWSTEVIGIAQFCMAGDAYEQQAKLALTDIQRRLYSTFKSDYNVLCMPRVYEALFSETSLGLLSNAAKALRERREGYHPASDALGVFAEELFRIYTAMMTGNSAKRSPSLCVAMGKLLELSENTKASEAYATAAMWYIKLGRSLARTMLVAEVSPIASNRVTMLVSALRAKECAEEALKLMSYNGIVKAKALPMMEQLLKRKDIEECKDIITRCNIEIERIGKNCTALIRTGTE